VTVAAVCTALTGEDAIEVREWPLDELGADGVRIDVRAASVNFPDVLIVRGEYQMKPELPFVAGTECAGDVVEVGPDVSAFAVGDRVLTVVGNGAFATGIVVRPDRQQTHVIPDEMSYDDAASFNITYGTGYYGLIRRGQLRAGESVVILGAAGGCGSAAIQIAKAAGATVIAVAGGEAKCALVRELGADVVLDHQQVESISAAVKEATDGRGVDVLFDTVGGADVREYLRCLAWNGRYLVIGFASGDIPTVRLNQTILKGISIVGVAYGASAMLDPASNVEDFAQLFSWYREGKVTPHISGRYPLDRASEAMQVVYDRAVLGKIVIEMPA
jgi:NADPH2:quinone reductase